MKKNIRHLIDFIKIDDLLEGFNKSTGFVTAIRDLDGKVLSKSGGRQICTEFHRINTVTSESCTTSYTVLSNKMAEDEKYHIYKCPNGLIDVAVPIIIEEVHVANLFSGQFFFEDPDIPNFKKQAKKYGFDEEKYITALKNVPVVSEERVKTVLDFLLNMIQLISEMIFQKLEQIELNKNIRDSEEKFKAVFESANVGKSITLLTGEINVNQAFCVMLGYTPEELRNTKWQELTPDDEIPTVQAIINPLLTGEKDSARFEKRYICKNGTYIWADVSVSLQHDENGKPLHFITTVIDITERKQAEKNLINSEKQYRSLFENMNSGFVLFEVVQNEQGIPIDLIILAANEGFEKTTGLNLKDAVGLHLTNVLPGIEKDEADWIGTYSKVALTGEAIQFEQGSELLGYFYSISAFRAAPNQCAVTFVDITERKQAEEKLIESESRFRKLYEDSANGMVMVGKDFKFLKANKTFCQMTGYKEKELQQLTFVDITHPDDRAIGIPQIKKMIAGEVSVYRTEKRYIKKDGETFWVQLTVSPIYDSEGQFLYNLAIIVNITAHKKAEIQMRESESLLAQSQEIAHIGSWKLDLTTGTLYWTDEVYRIFGCKPQEFTATYEVFLNFIHPDDRTAVDKAYSGSLREGIDSYEIEHRIVRRGTGEIRHVHERCVHVRNDVGVIIQSMGMVQDITEHKQAEEKRRQSDERFRIAQDMSPDGFTILRPVRDDQKHVIDFTWIYQNEAIARLNGTEPQKVVGQRLLELFPGHHDTKFIKVYKQVAESGKSITFEEGYSGESMKNKTWFRIVVVPMAENIAILAQDITERKHVEENLMRMTRIMKNSQEIAHLGSFEYVAATQTTIWSEEEYRIYGLDPDGPSPEYNEMLEKCIHPDDAKLLHDTFMAAMQNQNVYELEHRIVRPDGSVRWVYDKAHPYFDQHGNLLRYVGATLDITERKLLQEELEMLNKELEKKVEQRTALLEASNKELEAFSYSVSHDLRAPLRHINGYVDMLRRHNRDELSEKAQHYLDTISGASSQMGALIDDLLQYSRTGRKDVRKTELDLNALIKEVMEELKTVRKGRKINWDIKELPKVFGDYTLLKLVWTNLLDNATKYTHNQQTAKISVGFRVDAKEFVFWVKDNGVGFDMKYAHKLFGVFQRLHSKAEFEGTGIGLANVQRIVHKHLGRVWVEAEPDKGATFFFSLPKISEKK